MPSRPRYAHVLLDFDRTLNDSDLVYERNLNGFLGLTGQQVYKLWEDIHREILAKEPKEHHEDLELHYKLMLEELNRTNKETIQKELKTRLRAAQKECWYATALFDETLPFLNAMLEAGYTMHVATGDYAKLKAEGIERQGERSYFQHTYDEETLGVGKGKRDYYDRIIERLGLPAEETVIVGDSLTNDIVSGAEAGLATIWVRRKNEENKKGAKPSLTVATLMEALPHFVPPAG